MPEELLPVYSAVDVPTTIGGNAELGPETADTVTAGIVVRPRFESTWMHDLQFTIDWYRIEIDDVVTFVDAPTAVLNCFDRVYNPSYAADNYWCTLFGRDPGSGEIVDMLETFRNFATQTTSGIDFQLDWSLPVGPGELAIGWYVGWWTSSSSRRRAAYPQTNPPERSAALRAPTRIKWLASVRYAFSDLDVGLSWQYVDSTVDKSRFGPK